MNNIAYGAYGELLAERYLKKKGFIILAKNCKFLNAEIDIVAKLTKKVQIKKIKTDYKLGKYKSKEAVKILQKTVEDILVFVEVKYSSTRIYGEPYERVDFNKQKQIQKAAQMFIYKNRFEDMQCRYDVISIVGDEINHIENAF